MNEYDREPCPHRIYADAGSAFAMGLVGGSIFHAFKGWKNAPKGINPTLLNMAREVRMRSPLTGSQFAAWGGMFSVIDCCLVSVRKKEDPWNSISAGALTGGLLCARMGKSAMIVSALFGGVILSMIEGVGLLMNKLSTSQQYEVVMPPDEPLPPTHSKEKLVSGGTGNVHSTNFAEPSTSTGLLH